MSIVQRLWREYSSSILVIVKTFQNFTMVILGGGTIVHPKARIAALAGPIIIGLICSQYHQWWLNSKSQILQEFLGESDAWYDMISSIISRRKQHHRRDGRNHKRAWTWGSWGNCPGNTIFMWLETFQCDKWMNNISPSVLISKRDWQSLTESTVARNCCFN